MKAHQHLLGYLHRWTVCKIGKLHVRLHHLLTPDGTPFLHSHPFWYVSFIFEGGYSEQVLVDGRLVGKSHTAPALIFRHPSTYHRISTVDPVCKTICFTWLSHGWDLLTHPEIAPPAGYHVPSAPGVYQRIINGRSVYSKFDGGVWWVGKRLMVDAAESTQLSIHQCTHWFDA